MTPRSEPDPRSLSRRRFLGTAGALPRRCSATRRHIGGGALVRTTSAGRRSPPLPVETHPRSCRSKACTRPGSSRRCRTGSCSRRSTWSPTTARSSSTSCTHVDGRLRAPDLTAGLPVGPVNHDQDLPPDDTGEAVGLGPSSLTVTYGFGSTLFTRPGDPFGIAWRSNPHGALPDVRRRSRATRSNRDRSEGDDRRAGVRRRPDGLRSRDP